VRPERGQLPLDASSTVRDPGLVFLAGVVGVPWQDLARDPTNLAKGYKNPTELEAVNGQGMTTWDIVVGDPAQYIKPKDPHMSESIPPRSGVNPITGDAIKPPGNTSNPINGSEYSNLNQDDLQYACIFPLPVARDCGDARRAPKVSRFEKRVYLSGPRIDSSAGTRRA
jgi:hypothetical protein